MEDIRFHQCVRLGRFENERLVTFIPPDGKFELMSYRLDIRVKPLFTVDVIVENPSNTKIRFVIKVKSNYKEKSIANNVDIYVPVPEDVETPSFSTPICTLRGRRETSRYQPSNRSIVCSVSCILRRTSGGVASASAPAVTLRIASSVLFTSVSETAVPATWLAIDTAAGAAGAFAA